MDQNKNNQPGNQPDNNRPKWSILGALVATVVIIFIISSIWSAISNSQYTETSYSKFREYMEQDQLSEVEIQGDRILYLTKEEAAKDPSLQKAYFTGIPYNGDSLALGDELVAKGVPVVYPIERDNSSVIMILYYVLMFALILGSMRMISRRMSGEGMMGGLGKSKAKVYMEKQTGVTFQDVAGQDEAKESLMEIIDFLHNPQKYTAIGAKLPKGALLVGSPGTGKTLIAKAVAGEANVPFFSISGSDFVEMFVGMGASRVRDLFQQAAKVAPCIIFIDEIDAVGRSRDTRYGGKIGRAHV